MDSNGGDYHMILYYSIQNKKFECIVNKHWEILGQDQELGPLLPVHLFLDRGAPSLHDTIDLPKNPGFYVCGKSAACRNSKVNTNKNKKSLRNYSRLSQRGIIELDIQLPVQPRVLFRCSNVNVASNTLEGH